MGDKSTAVAMPDGGEIPPRGTDDRVVQERACRTEAGAAIGIVVYGHPDRPSRLTANGCSLGHSPEIQRDVIGNGYSVSYSHRCCPSDKV